MLNKLTKKIAPKICLLIVNFPYFIFDYLTITSGYNVWVLIVMNCIIYKQFTCFFQCFVVRLCQVSCNFTMIISFSISDCLQKIVLELFKFFSSNRSNFLFKKLFIKISLWLLFLIIIVIITLLQVTSSYLPHSLIVYNLIILMCVCLE